MVPPTGFVLSAAFVLGIALHGSGLFLPVLIFLSGCLAISWLWHENKRVLLLSVMCLLVIVAGMVRVRGESVYPETPAGLTGTGSFSGVVLDVPRVSPGTSQSRMQLTEPVETNVWAQLPPYPDVQQGDIVEVQGTFLSNDRTTFRGMSAQRDTVGVIYGEQTSVTGNRATWLQRSRSSTADHIRQQIQQRIPEPAGAFATGVLLGDDGAMTESTRHAFQVGGLTHMTAVSGVHVGLIAGVLLLVSRLGLISRWWMLGMSIPFIWSFAYLVGMRPSVVRASLMLTLLVAAHFLGRPRDTLNAVGIAAAVMLLVDPSYRYDIGFQLSVAATLGIALGVLLLGNRSHWHLVWVVPLSAQLATEPLILYHFGYYSLVSPVANILATPFLAVTMAMSIATVSGSLLSATLADALAVGTWVPATVVVTIAEASSAIPYLSGDAQPLSISGVWTAYALLCGLAAVLFVLLRRDSRDSEGELELFYRV
jgi:competence protein ComEC